LNSEKLLARLQEALGYFFNDPGLLTHALTHASFAYENGLPPNACNERLEFLGDAVLELCVSELLYTLFPGMSEGKLTSRRAALVCEPQLAALARDLRIGKCIRLGNGEDQSGGREKGSILSDALEAVLGAIYLDGGADTVRGVVFRLFKPLANDAPALRDNKTTLQEILQKNSRETAVYYIIDESGPPHNRIFTAQVTHQGNVLGKGAGGSKKEAEQAAAGAALKSTPPK